MRALFKAEAFTPVAIPDVPPHLRKSLMDLEPGDCRWPCGDPQSADFGFCGAQKLEGVSYCALHSRVAFQSSVVQRRFIPGVKQAERETEDA